MRNDFTPLLPHRMSFNLCPIKEQRRRIFFNSAVFAPKTSPGVKKSSISNSFQKQKNIHSLDIPDYCLDCPSDFNNLDGPSFMIFVSRKDRSFCIGHILCLTLALFFFLLRSSSDFQFSSLYPYSCSYLIVRIVF